MVIAGVGQAVAGHVSANQQATAENRNRKRLYDWQLYKKRGVDLANLTDYNLRVVDYDRQLAKNTRDASLLFQAEQRKINKSAKESLLEAEAAFIEGITNPLLSKAAERGNTRAMQSIKAKEGRRVAKGRAKVDQTISDFSAAANTIFWQHRDANQRARIAMGLQPVPGINPMKPTFNKGRGLGSLLISAGAAAATSFAGGKSAGLEGGFLFPNA